MALKKNQLLEALDQLRETLITSHYQKYQVTIDVCSDQALKEIATKKPQKPSDFLAISGLDKDFVDRFGTIFLQTIKNLLQENIKEVKVSKNAKKVLYHYKDRLTNISRTNPNLYMGRITQINSFDLVTLDFDKEIADFLTNPRVKNLRLPITGEALEKHITTLYRETNKVYLETGSYDLYLTYPYVEGMFSKDQFAIKAPLLFFPVKLTRTMRTFTLVKDQAKDIIFNRDLLLASSKLEKSVLESAMPELDGFNIKTLNEIVIPFYEKHGIKFTKTNSSLLFTPFKNELKEDFVKHVKKQFILKEYVTLTRFELYSSSIQKDIENILISNKYNDLLEGLIDEKNLYDDEKQTVFRLEDGLVDESKLTYINDLNYSQEKVIDLLNHERKIVIWGPPGTGKSQTITSLIASSILKGENVLVVSEKKVAIDVIYSRLRQASKYALFIDDAENKQGFYDAIKKFIDPEPPTRTKNNDVYEMEVGIKNILKDLNQSVDLLYNDKIEGIPVYRLYQRYIKDKDVIEDLSPLVVNHIFKETFGKISFKMLDVLEKTFDSNQVLKRYLDFHHILTKYPFIQKYETKISRSGKLAFETFHQAWLETSIQFQEAGFFKRFKLKKTFMREQDNKLLFLTKKKSLHKQYLKLLFKDVSLHQYIFNNLSQLNKFMEQYKELTPLSKTYLSMFNTHPKLISHPHPHQLRQYLFDAYYTGYLEAFKTNHQKYLYIFDKYREKMDELNDFIDDKRQISVESFEMELYKHALNFSNTKRIMDIKRLLESNKKPSIKAFIDTFQVEISNHIRLFMMTPEVVSAILPLNYGMFDLVIFDEASQMYVEKGIPAIYRSKKVVIAGDPKQLRPSSLGFGRIEEDDEFYEQALINDVSLDSKSLLDLARYRFKEALLNYHYRSSYEELIAFSNHAFYDAKLIVSPNQRNSEQSPIEYLYVKQGIFEKRSNEQEAKAVVALLKKVFNERKNNETIGIITFNSSQRDLILNHIDKELFRSGVYQKHFEAEMFRKEDNEDKSLFVKNIENVQGDERDIIIFSMGYAKDKNGVLMRRFGWLNHEGGQNRLNVAITRAKKKIYFVSSLTPEEFRVDDLISTGPKLLKDFMRYCYAISNQNYEVAKTVLDNLYTNEKSTQQMLHSVMVSDIKQRLIKHGFEAVQDIGIGRYKIDLAIKYPNQNGYKLGIIAHFNDTNINARRDLLHQEKYLKSRNWNIYRVFEPNWYMNPNQEIKIIRDLLK